VLLAEDGLDVPHEQDEVQTLGLDLEVVALRLAGGPKAT